MYMPLCRECHKRESNLNKENTFLGDPSVISIDTENKPSPPKDLTKCSSLKETSDTTTNSSKNSSAGGSPQARSFSQRELEQDNTIQLRQQV